MFDTILNEIDAATNESELCVLESMLMSLNKAYDILSYTDNDDIIDSLSIIQEAAIQSDETPADTNADLGKKKEDKKDNIFVSIVKAIIKFFKSIGSAIAGFFKKTKDTITGKLRKFSKKDTKNTKEETQKKADDISKKGDKRLRGKINEKFVEKNNSKSKKDVGADISNTTGIEIKEKKIRTKIKFQTWIDYLSSTEAMLNAINNNEIHTDSKKPVILYSFFPHKYNVSEVADYVDKIIVLLKSVNEKLAVAEHKMEEVLSFYKKETKAIDNSKQVSPLLKHNKDRKKIEQHIRNVSDSIANVTVCVANMTGYLADELGIYNIILDTIMPAFDKLDEMSSEKRIDTSDDSDKEEKKDEKKKED